jgi:hypothetical protein
MRKELEKKDEIITLKARTLKYKKAPVYVCPMIIDSSGKMNDGLDTPALKEYIRDENHKKEIRLAFPLDEELSFPIKDSDSFNVNNNHDLGLLGLVLTDPSVAHSKSTVRPRHRFYINRKEAESRASISVFADKAKALVLVNQISDTATDESIRDTCRIINLVPDVSALSLTKCLEMLFEYAEKNPKKFITRYNDPYAVHKAFIARLIEGNLITKRVNGYVNSENYLVAIDEPSFIRYILDGENAQIVDEWAVGVGYEIKPKVKLPNGKFESSAGEAGKGNNLLSKDIHHGKASSAIKEMNDKGQINSYVIGETRDSVIAAANKQIEAITPS